jgi:hypothetical protein
MDPITEPDENSVAAIFSEHSAAERGIQQLQKIGFNLNKLSIVGQEYQIEDSVVGFYTVGDRMKYWGKLGAFWGGLWGLLAGAAFLIIPGIGPVVVAGPVVAWIIGALEGTVLVGGLSALGAGLVSLGIPKHKVLHYENSLRSGKFLLIAHTTHEETDQIRELLTATEAEEVDIQELPPEPARVA